MYSPKLPTASENNQQANWSSRYFRQQETQREKGFMGWWYSLSAPPTPPAAAPLKEREIARRGRLTSAVLLAFVVLIVAVGVPARVLQDPAEGVLIVGLILPLLVAIWFNRHSRINISGFIVVAILSGALTAILTFFQPGGLTVNSIALYDLMVQTELFAVSLLPERIVFVAAAYNCIFIVANFELQPHAQDLNALVAQSGLDVLVRPIALNLTVAVITYLWVHSATQAIKRADRAEVIATLQHDLAEQAQITVKQKQLLDKSIQQIVETQRRVANGDLSARVPLDQDNVLWEVAGALNNLLARYQRAHLVEGKVEELQARLQWAYQVEHQFKLKQQEQKYITNEINKQIQTLRAAKQRQLPLLFKPTHTPIDPLLSELNGHRLVSP